MPANKSASVAWGARGVLFREVDEGLGLRVVSKCKVVKESKGINKGISVSFRVK